MEFGKPPKPALVEKILRDLSLWDKKDAKIITLSGGMKRRHMIAKALSHEPEIPFLDEPSAGVDVELRQTLWQFVANLNRQGHTVLLTTHNLERGLAWADRAVILNGGKIRYEGLSTALSAADFQQIYRTHTAAA